MGGGSDNLAAKLFAWGVARQMHSQCGFAAGTARVALPSLLLTLQYSTVLYHGDGSGPGGNLIHTYSIDILVR